MNDIVERLRRGGARFDEMHSTGEQPWVADAAWAAEDLNTAADEIERLRAEAAAARDEGGREALTGALHPEFGSIYAPNGAATVAREAGRREGIEAALTAALRMWPEADDLHDAIRTLLEEGGR